MGKAEQIFFLHKINFSSPYNNHPVFRKAYNHTLVSAKGFPFSTQAQEQGKGRGNAQKK